MASHNDSAVGDPDDEEPSGSGDGAKLGQTLTGEPQKTLASDAQEELVGAVPEPQDGPSCLQSPYHHMCPKSPVKEAPVRMALPAENDSGTVDRAPQATQATPQATPQAPLAMRSINTDRPNVLLGIFRPVRKPL
ncbi:uncharacterized protein LOC144138168 [Haemaphysalis longicornis]